MSGNDSTNGAEAIFLAGFLTDAGTGGFEWRLNRAEVQAIHARWVEEGDRDVSPVREVAAPVGLSNPDEVTKALDGCPELWEPRKGEGRSDTDKLAAALERGGWHAVAAEVRDGVELSWVSARLRERGEGESWAAHTVHRVAVGAGAPVAEELACERCGGALEASAKVYFDVTAAQSAGEGPVKVTGLEFSSANDSYDGHPVAMEHEINVSCSECGRAPDFVVEGAAEARTSFHPGPVGAVTQTLGAARASEALRVEARAREAMAEVYEEQGNGDAVLTEQGRAEYLRKLADDLAIAPIISLLYTEEDVLGYAADAEVGEQEALKRAEEWGRHIQDTAARLCSEQLMAVVIGGQP